MSLDLINMYSLFNKGVNEESVNSILEIIISFGASFAKLNQIYNKRAVRENLIFDKAEKAGSIEQKKLKIKQKKALKKKEKYNLR